MRSRTASLPVMLAWTGALLLSTSRAFAADKDVVELQRDVALVGEQVKNLQTTVNNLQTTVNEKMGAMGVLMQQTLDRANQIHTEGAASVKSLGDQLRQQEQQIAAPFASLSAKLDQVATQISAIQDNIADLSSRLGRQEQRLVDLENAVKVLQAPPAPPPPNPQPGAPPPGTSAQGLFQDAQRDQLAGHSDLALQEYRDYLKYFGDTETAATAQFHIGEMLLNQGDFDDAIQAFDRVIVQNPKSRRAPDALYLKAQALQKQGDRAAAMKALNQLIRQYPDSDAAATAKTELPRAKTPLRK
jgi:tol-pal system protein YbgF